MWWHHRDSPHHHTPDSTQLSSEGPGPQGGAVGDALTPSAGPGGGGGAGGDTQAQLEADKRAVYRHPLFPLLALLFERCEEATLGSDSVSSAGFDLDIEGFVQRQESERKPFFSDEPEIDNLMVKAIQVLRIHLLELEKVSDLCKDFCSRYITCLKSKMHSDNLLRSDVGPSNSYLGEPQALGLTSGDAVAVVSVPAPSVAVATLQSAQVLTGGTIYQPVTMVTPHGQVVAQAMTQATTATALQIHGAQSVVSSPCVISGICTTSHLQADNMGGTHLGQDISSCDPDDKRARLKRGVLPKHATTVMRSWLFQHIVHPYPTEDEKRQIANQTNLTLLQVNNWFINARRRILQPMLDASNPDPSPRAARKLKAAPRPSSQRFWPDSLDGCLSDPLNTLSSDSATLAVRRVIVGHLSDDGKPGASNDHGHAEDDQEEDEDEEEEDGDEENIEDEEEEEDEEENGMSQRSESGLALNPGD
ncbi:homeobox protein PKNOX2-like isoform X4 [Lethenteron reissneri]|uniref:homeobox protein PKNOX2-like isoform X4 n=1 Tax=Lethenteron reissneri TaxID=7753 RepID=UPI002AB7BC54|nr:homeobox protein PKNOX2-like isoform X4 [Lethenteron reissneri]